MMEAQDILELERAVGKEGDLEKLATTMNALLIAKEPDTFEEYYEIISSQIENWVKLRGKHTLVNDRKFEGYVKLALLSVAARQDMSDLVAYLGLEIELRAKLQGETINLADLFKEIKQEK